MHVSPCAHARARKRAISIDQVLLMVNGEELFPIHLHFNGRLVTERQPKAGNPLVLPDKLGSINPEGRLFGRVAGDFHDREIIGIDPYFPLEQILLPALRSSLDDKAMIRAEILFSGKRKCVVRARDRTVMVLPTRRCLALALHQAIKHQVTHEPRSFLGGLVERFLVGRLILHADHGLRSQFPLGVSDLVRPDCRVPPQLLVTQPVALKHSYDDVVACQASRGTVIRYTAPSISCTAHRASSEPATPIFWFLSKRITMPRQTMFSACERACRGNTRGRRSTFCPRTSSLKF